MTQQSCKRYMLDVTAIEKSVDSINSLCAEAKLDFNQFVRWVSNKEHHANNIIINMSYFYLAQRVKAADKSNKKKYEVYQKHLESITRLLDLL